MDPPIPPQAGWMPCVPTLPRGRVGGAISTPWDVAYKGGSRLSCLKFEPVQDPLGPCYNNAHSDPVGHLPSWF